MFVIKFYDCMILLTSSEKVQGRSNPFGQGSAQLVSCTVDNASLTTIITIRPPPTLSSTSIGAWSTTLCFSLEQRSACHEAMQAKCRFQSIIPHSRQLYFKYRRSLRDFPKSDIYSTLEHSAQSQDPCRCPTIKDLIW